MGQHEAGHALERGLAHVRARHDVDDLRQAAVGDVTLLTVQDPLVALFLGGHAHTAIRLVVGQNGIAARQGLSCRGGQQAFGIVHDARQPFLALLGRSQVADHGHDLPGLVESHRDAQIAVGQVFTNHRQGHHISATAAELLRHRQRAQAQLVSLADHLPVKRLGRVRFAVARVSHRNDFLDGKFAGLVAKRFLLLRQCELNHLLPPVYVFCAFVAAGQQSSQLS